MNIFKSQIRIFKQGEESTLIFEMVVDHGEILEDEYRAFTLGNEVLLYSVGEDGKLSKVSIETYKNSTFYEYLKKKEYEYIHYEPDRDTEYLIDVFERNDAQKYINFDASSSLTVSYEEFVDEEEKVYAQIDTYELNVEKVLEYVLDMEALDELTDESFNKSINNFLSSKLLEKADFLKSIKLKRIMSGKQELFSIEKINGKKFGQVYIKSPYESNVKSEIVTGGLSCIYFKGNSIIDDFSYEDIRFCEDDSGDEIFFIVEKRKYSASDIADMLCMRTYKSFKHVIVGITSKDDVNDIL